MRFIPALAIRLRFWVVMGFWAGVTSAAHATTFFPVPFPESVQDAPLIVRGRTGTSHADWATGPDGARRIYTYTEFEVTELLKGKVREHSISLRELGGEKDGTGLHVPGTAHFGAGEDLVVFLSDRDTRQKAGEGPVEPGVPAFDVRGMMMGRFDIRKDADGAEYLAGGSLGQSEHALRSEGEVAGNGTVKNWTLDRLRELVKEQAKSTAGTQNGNIARTAAAIPPPSPAPSPHMSSSYVEKSLGEAAADALDPSVAATASRFPPAWAGNVGLWLGGIGILVLFLIARRRRQR